MNDDTEEYKEELKLSEPIIWDLTRETPEEAQKIGMNKEMKSMKDFTVYTEKPIEECAEEQVRNAIGVKWVKRWKRHRFANEIVGASMLPGRTGVGFRHTFRQHTFIGHSQSHVDHGMARSWCVKLADVSTAFLHAPMKQDIFIWPAAENYPDFKCLWKLNKAMCSLKQSPRLWQEHFAKVMSKSGFRH